MEEDEEGTIILTRVADLQPRMYNQEFVATATIIGNEKVEMDLVPGIYKVTGLLTSNKQLVIPKMERCTGGVVEAVFCWDTEGCCFDFEKMVLEQVFSGQISWDTESTYITITPEQLYGAEEITFYILHYNLAGVSANQRVVEDLQVMGELGNLSKELQDSLTPRFT